jgi:hypothetical protein
MQLDLFGAPKAPGAVRATLPAPAAGVPCRVRGCPIHAGETGLCHEHDTPGVQAMSRPHRYMFEGRHIVLESTPWPSTRREATVDDVRGFDVAVAQELAQAPDGGRVDQEVAAVAAVAQLAAARPCWTFCGRPGPARGCHPGSRYSQAPTTPCLACGRPLLPCRAAAGSALTCSPPCRELWAALQSGDDAAVEAFARAHLSEDAVERWEERTAIMHLDRPRGAAGRALAGIWRGLHG